jgi:CRISPR/Cas system-associated endonuclease Cas3-HD
MEKNNVQRSKIREIHSMHELQLEKARLKMEVMKAEEKVKGNYRNIVEALSLRNIVTTVTSELVNPSSVIAKVFTFGKNWLSRRKKKKQAGKQHEPKAGDGGQKPEARE